jgi:hypothetical protein
MEIVEVHDLSPDIKQSIYLLWNLEYPNSIRLNSLDDLSDFLNSIKKAKHYIVKEQVDGFVGWAVKFSRDNEDWFAMIINSNVQKMGYGTKLLSVLKENSEKLNAWVIDHNQSLKINGSLYKSPLNFYLKNGFIIKSEVRLEEYISAVQVEWYKSQ